MDSFPAADQDCSTSHSLVGLRLFLDSADPDDWQRYLPLGIFYGVTTNPLLLERARQTCTLANLEKLTRLAITLGAGQIHLQTWGRNAQEMIHHGHQLAQLAGLGIDVAVKVPATQLGFQVARQLKSSGCKITLTAVYNPSQILLAAGFGAAYAAPYLGRINDQGRDGREQILAMRDILKATQSGTRLLVASLRSANDVVDLARLGLDTLTFGSSVAADLLKENFTDLAAEDFQRAAEAMTGPGE